MGGAQPRNGTRRQQDGIKKVRVGIIGMAPGRGWGSMAIAPALRALPQFEMKAVSTRHIESARASAREFGIPLAFDNHHALVTHPDVDLVVVAVRVPAHYELVMAALEAGKHVYCEWPLASNLKEASELVESAKQRGVRGFIGLQLRSAPFIQYVRDLIAEGYVGKVLSTSILAPALMNGADVSAEHIYTLDAHSGACMLTVTVSHTLDAALHALRRRIIELSATTATQRKTVRVIETGEMIPMTAEDQVAVSGTLSADAVFSLHYWGGPATAGDRGFQWRIHGSEGELKMTAAGVNIQVTEVTIEGARSSAAMQVLPVPRKYESIADATGPARYVAAAFSRMAADLRLGTQTCPSFEDALPPLEIIEAIRRAARSGRRQSLSDTGR
jgi:predicted dehydrogenase